MLMAEKDYFKGSHNPFNVPRSILHDIRFYANNPFYFDPCGIWVFCGAQGSGKTLSAVKACKKILHEYPAAKLCTNLSVTGLEPGTDVIPFVDYSQIKDLSNGIYGMVFLLDEIHVIWNSLESKNIPISEMATFAQMRKDRRLIIGTSQVYSRIAKPIREQLKYVIMCHSILKYIQVNSLIDPNADGYTGENNGELDGELLRRYIWFHSPADYDSYDTYNKIKRMERSKK